jgi:isopentenyl-diphosphate delta-isomerase
MLDGGGNKLTGAVDYILFCALDVTVDANPNEVSAAKYVSKDELEAMFADPGMLD